MNTVLLQYALEVEKTGSITQAANNLYMEQPNLSKAIKTLEEMMGAPIFKRTSKGVTPTQKGKEFLKYAESILKQIEEMEAVYKGREQSREEFRLFIPRATYISEAYSRFVRSLDRTKPMDLWLRETNSMETISAAAEEKCRMGIIRYPVELEKSYNQMLKENELESSLVWKYEPMLLMSGNHPLAGDRPVVKEKLKRYMEILHGDIKLSAPASEKNAEEEDKREAGRIYVYERGSQFNLLETNPDTYMWVSPLPSQWLARHGLVQKRCMDMKRQYKDVLVCRKDYRMNAWEESFMEQVQKVKKEILNEIRG